MSDAVIGRSSWQALRNETGLFRQNFMVVWSLSNWFVLLQRLNSSVVTKVLANLLDEFRDCAFFSVIGVMYTSSFIVESLCLMQVPDLDRRRRGHRGHQRKQTKRVGRYPAHPHAR